MNVDNILQTSGGKIVTVAFDNDILSAVKFLEEIEKNKRKLPNGSIRYGRYCSPKKIFERISILYEGQIRYLMGAGKPIRIEIVISLGFSRRFGYGYESMDLNIYPNCYSGDNIDNWRRYHNSSDVIQYYTLDEFRNVFDIDL